MTTAIADADAGPVRARCPHCFVRFRWPTSAPPAGTEPLHQTEVACPSCRLVIPLAAEPCDERWWAYVTSEHRQPRPAAATRTQPAPVVHTPRNGERPLRGRPPPPVYEAQRA